MSFLFVLVNFPQSSYHRRGLKLNGGHLNVTDNSNRAQARKNSEALPVRATNHLALGYQSRHLAVSMELSEYLPILIQILLAVGIGVSILGFSHLFGQKGRPGKIKDSPYECGMATEKPGKTSYSVKFYITAMLFILFDVDVVFLIPWVLTHRDLVAAGIPILGPMLFFTAILGIGLLYELKSGALEWEK